MKSIPQNAFFCPNAIGRDLVAVAAQPGVVLVLLPVKVDLDRPLSNVHHGGVSPLTVSLSINSVAHLELVHGMTRIIPQTLSWPRAVAANHFEHERSGLGRDRIDKIVDASRIVPREQFPHFPAASVPEPAKTGVVLVEQFPAQLANQVSTRICARDKEPLRKVFHG